MNENRIVKPFVFEIDKIEATDIDDPEDFIIAEILYKEQTKEIEMIPFKHPVSRLKQRLQKKTTVGSWLTIPQVSC